MMIIIIIIIIVLQYSFVPSFHWHVQNAEIPCHCQELLPYSLTSSCYLFLGLCVGLIDSELIYNTLLGILFSPFSVHVQTSVIYVFYSVIDIYYT
jgi:hypothetical protein